MNRHSKFAPSGKVKRETGATNQRTRERYFKLKPLCEKCLLETPPRTTLATELDHIVALVNGGTNADSNRQGLCSTHHEAKTAQDLGHKPKQRIGIDGWPIE